MTTKYNTVSFETAQRLHDAGVRLQTAFHYDSKGEICEMLSTGEMFYLGIGKWSIASLNGETYIPSPTFQELWDALPKEIALSYGNFLLSITPLQDIYSIGYGSLFAITINGLTEAAAELLLLLKEKGIWHIK